MLIHATTSKATYSVPRCLPGWQMEVFPVAKCTGQCVISKKRKPATKVQGIISANFTGETTADSSVFTTEARFLRSMELNKNKKFAGKPLKRK